MNYLDADLDLDFLLSDMCRLLTSGVQGCSIFISFKDKQRTSHHYVSKVKIISKAREQNPKNIKSQISCLEPVLFQWLESVLLAYNHWPSVGNIFLYCLQD